MCDVTSENFEELLPEIRNLIRSCSFVAFDTEFTALTIGQGNRTSLFDSMEERYTKLKSSADKSIICQVGISIFHNDIKENTYFASTFNFYICPQSFGPIDDVFAFQSSALNFLVQSGFDFNQFAKKGIGYLNVNQEENLKKCLGEGQLLRSLERNLTYANEEDIQKICSDLASWMQGKKLGEEKSVECGNVPKYILIQEIRTKFGNIWSMADKTSKDQVLCRIVSCEDKRNLLADKSQDISEEVVEYQKGFSIVIEEIVAQKKPIVGHNCFTDLLKIQKQFVKDLPDTYEEFKLNVHSDFPLIFDTKHLCFHVRKAMEIAGKESAAVLLGSTNLKDLFSVLGSSKDKFVFMHSPRVKHNPSEQFGKYHESEIFHEAGFDAFATGFCFLKLAHVAASLNYISFSHMKPFNFNEHLYGVRNFKNQVNISRAAITYTNLEGVDPESNRPPWLVISSKKHSRMDNIMVTEIFARFGSLDTRQISKGKVLMAVSNFGMTRDIQRFAQENPEIWTIRKYNVWRDGAMESFSGNLSLAIVSLTAAVSILIISKKIWR